MRKRSALALLCAALALPISAATAQSKEKAPAAANETKASIASRPGYTGDAACTSCHRAEALAYEHTGHHLTSQLANRQTVLGDFLPGANSLTISDPNKSPSLPALFFRMDARPDGLYETAATGWGDHLLTKTERIDIVTGSGARGQTYLSWQGDQLFELPVSYWTDGRSWVNSPGFIDGSADFARPVNPGCLECHASYIQPLSSDALTNSYEKQTLETGISCETCHGPGAEHVSRYSSRPPNSSPLAETGILNPAKFSRDRQVDSCAYCHNGIQRQAIQPAFSFVPGKPLDNYFKPLPVDSAEHPDVHGNQVGLLQRSRCYQSSAEMSCSTCHNTHAAEKPAASYSTACLKCHQWTSCGLSKQLGHKIVDNCIDCHMPVETTKVIVSESAGEVVRAKMRNHWIKVYPAVKLTTELP